MCMCLQVGCELGLASDSKQEWWRLRCRALDERGDPLTPALHHGFASQPPAPSAWQRLRHANTRLRAQDVPASDLVHTQCASAGSGNGAAGGESAWGPPMLVAAVERVQSGLLGETLSSVGITGLYVTLIFGLGRFVRLALTNLRMRIPYQDLPNVAHLTTLCNDIAVAREEGELLLEEQLFYSLLNIYRSPSVLFEVTKKDR